MITSTDPKTLIQKTRDLCKAATPGPCKLVIRNDGAGDFADFQYLPDAYLYTAAPTLLMDLAQELEACLQYKSQLTLTLSQHRDTQQRLRTARTELADHKAKMVGLLAHAYDKGRAFSEDTDDRTSEHG